jgi:hypothetical protein
METIKKRAQQIAEKMGGVSKLMDNFHLNNIMTIPLVMKKLLFKHIQPFIDWLQKRNSSYLPLFLSVRSRLESEIQKYEMEKKKVL